MVDWETVERRRAKGWDWDRIAADPKVDFHAEASAGEPGRALRALYYQRRSRQKRRPGTDGPGGAAGEAEAPERRWTIARVGMLLTPLFGFWFLLAFVFPSPVGTYLSAIPLLGLLLAISGAVLAFGLLKATERWNAALRNTAIVGAIVGLVIAGSFGVAAVASGCPTLSPNTTGQPLSFVKAPNPAWKVNGASVFFFFGSAACPFCSASSWAAVVALQKFGTLSGWVYGHSSPTDPAGPNTPEAVLAGASLQSPYVALDIAETTDENTITTPALGQCIEQAYVSAYDPGGSIPFIVINGQYVHVGTLVTPSSLAGLTPAQVWGQLQNESGPAWDAVSPSAYYLMAFLYKTDGGQPASVGAIPNVQQDLGQIT